MWCRQAFAELYAGQARQMAERMGKLRQKERDKREAFRKQVQAYIPLPVLAGLGLTQQPPHCQISLPPPAPGLPSITLADLQKGPLSADPAVRIPARTPPRPPLPRHSVRHFPRSPSRLTVSTRPPRPRCYPSARKAPRHPPHRWLPSQLPLQRRVRRRPWPAG